MRAASHSCLSLFSFSLLHLQMVVSTITIITVSSVTFNIEVCWGAQTWLMPSLSASVTRCNQSLLGASLTAGVDWLSVS